MAEIFLVRHGQASFGADNYDKLSSLGIQQSVWLGEYFKSRNESFDSVLMGSMVRHKETAMGILDGMQDIQNPQIDDGLNEFDFQNVAEAYLRLYPEEAVDKQAPRAAFYRLLKKAMLAWAAGELHESALTETWQHFEGRVHRVLENIQQSDAKRILVVSSGGAIATLLGKALATGPETIINLNLQIRNASVSQLFAGLQSAHLATFNHTPHLDSLDRRHAITYS